MTTTPTPSVGHQRISTKILPISPTYVIDVIEARRQLLTEFEKTAQNSEMDQQVQEPGRRREWSWHFPEAFEQGSYWLIWAAVLTGLAFGMFGL